MQISGVDNTMYVPDGMPSLQNTENPVDAGRIEDLKKTGKVECQTCKQRKYMDVSTDSGVSFKTPGHISPEASAAVVSGHEGEHVAAAKAEGAKSGNKLVSASVTLHTAICPECGRAYVSGGETRTQISYSDPSKKRGETSIDEDLKGAVIDKKV